MLRSALRIPGIVIYASIALLVLIVGIIAGGNVGPSLLHAALWPIFMVVAMLNMSSKQVMYLLIGLVIGLVIGIVTD